MTFSPSRGSFTPGPTNASPSTTRGGSPVPESGTLGSVRGAPSTRRSYRVPVIGVGVDDQLRIRDVLLHDEGIDRGHDHVVTSVHDECWLLDRLQIVVGTLLLDAPLVHRFNLGGRNLVVHLGIAPLLTKMLALQELQSRRLDRLGRTEEDREPEMLGRIIGGTEDPLCYLGQRRHALTAARTGTH